MLCSKKNSEETRQELPMIQLRPTPPRYTDTRVCPSYDESQSSFNEVTLKPTKLYKVMGYKPLAMGYNPVVSFRTSAGQQGLSSLRPTTRPQSKGVRSRAPQELSNGGYIPTKMAILLVKMMIVHGKWGCLPVVNAGMCSYPSLG